MSPDTFNIDVILLAIKHGRELNFRYAKADGKSVEDRALLPADLDLDSGLMSGHDPDRDAPRQYRLDRILGDIELL